MKQSIEYGLEKVGLPFVEIQINGNGYHFLIDTGSTNNHLANSFFLYLMTQDVKTIMETGKYATTTGIGGEYKTGIYSMKFLIGDMEFEDLFIPIEDERVFDDFSKKLEKPCCGILGSKFLMENHINIDYVNKLVFSEHPIKVYEIEVFYQIQLFSGVYNDEPKSENIKYKEHFFVQSDKDETMFMMLCRGIRKTKYVQIKIVREHTIIEHESISEKEFLRELSNAYLTICF